MLTTCSSELYQSVLLEIVFVYGWSRFGWNLSSFLQQTFDVFPDQIRFQIDRVADLLEAQGGNLRRVRNNRDGKTAICHLVDRQADAVYGDRPLHDAVAQNLRRGFDREKDGVPVLLTAANRADAVHVTGHEVPSEPFVELHRPFQIERGAGRELPESGHGQCFRRDLDGKVVLSLVHHSQTSPVDADAV